jgi:hypothetical protein
MYFPLDKPNYKHFLTRVGGSLFQLSFLLITHFQYCLEFKQSQIKIAKQNLYLILLETPLPRGLYKQTYACVPLIKLWGL